MNRLERTWIGVGPALQHRRAGRHESRHVSRNLLGAEQRCKQAPLPPPQLAFRDERPFAAALPQNAIVNRVLAEAFAVFEEDVLDQLRVHDEDGLKAEIVVDHNRLFIEVPRASSTRKGSRPFGGFGTSVMEESNAMVP